MAPRPLPATGASPPRRDECGKGRGIYNVVVIGAGTAGLVTAAGTAIDLLQLDKAGVRAGQRGVEVNDYLQTSQPHIYAASDVTGRFLFTHMADYQARVVVRNILMPLQLLRQRADYSVVPWATYTDPEIARVGLSETEATKAGIAYDLYRQPMDGVDRAVVEDATAGFAKVLTRKGTDEILSATIVAERFIRIPPSSKSPARPATPTTKRA